MRAKELHDASLEERVAVERDIWDRVRDETFTDKSLLESTRPTYEALFTAYPEYRYVYDFFGSSVAGKRVLEVGCGSGVLSVALAVSGAHVVATDVSTSGLKVTRERAAHYGVSDRVETIESAAEELELAEQTFDLFVGKSVVHHLIIDQAMPRLYRFLAPGGRGAIFEPQGNALLNFARAHLPYPGKVDEEHGTDEFFTRATIEQIIAHFDYGEFREFRLLGMLQKFIPGRGEGFAARRTQEDRWQRFRRLVDPIDEALFRLVPPLRRLAQVVVLRVGRR